MVHRVETLVLHTCSHGHLSPLGSLHGYYDEIAMRSKIARKTLTGIVSQVYRRPALISIAWSASSRQQIREYGTET